MSPLDGLDKLAIGSLHLAPAASWRLIGVALTVAFFLLAAALLWLAARRLQVGSDARDIGDEGLLGLVASDPLAPGQPAALEPARAEAPALKVPVPAEAPPERGLPVEIRPRITAEDLPALTAVAEAPPALVEASAPPPQAPPMPSMATEKPPVPQETLPSPATATLSAAPTGALPASPTPTSPLAQDIRERLARAPSPVGREETVPLTKPVEQVGRPAPAIEDFLPEAQKTPTGEARGARLTERLPAQRKALRPPPPVPAAEVASVAPAAPPPLAPLPVQFVPKVAPSAPLRRAAEVAPPRFLDDDRPTGIGREAAWLVVMLALFFAALGSLAIVFLPAARNRALPPTWAERVAAIPRGLGIEAAPPPPVPAKQVEVRQYANAYSSAPKGATGKIVRTVTISGLVTNITAEKLFDLRAEIELYPREPEGAPPERRIIYLTPSLLEPRQEGRYTLTVADADYRQSSLKRIVTGDGKDLKEVPAIFILGTLEPPEAAPAPAAPPRRR
ncbi:MAG: hypothetical protein CFK52_04975 [Chloracidobacterium sp. CP2_5A]|nr:MAG: hypothetical protein CFK52_04975 [Chloracidobacterium sp. CP2_5A]